MMLEFQPKESIKMAVFYDEKFIMKRAKISLKNAPKSNRFLY